MRYVLDNVRPVLVPNRKEDNSPHKKKKHTAPYTLHLRNPPHVQNTALRLEKSYLRHAQPPPAASSAMKHTQQEKYGLFLGGSIDLVMKPHLNCLWCNAGPLSAQPPTTLIFRYKKKTCSPLLRTIVWQKG